MLDPACGSGNFLYLALQALKDLEHQVQLEAQALGLERQFPTIGPANVKGIEINPYAAELARVSVWIGEIQWMLRNGFAEVARPDLAAAGHHRMPRRGADAGRQGAGLAGRRRGDRQSAVSGRQAPARGWARTTWRGAMRLRPRMPAEADLVCYWFDKAQRLIAGGDLVRAGLVGDKLHPRWTQPAVLDRIVDQGRDLRRLV